MRTGGDQFDWLLPSPHTLTWHIGQAEIDHYDHANNVAYVAMLEKVAWSHSNALGLDIDLYRALDRGMVIRRHEIDYLKPALLADNLLCATWIVHCDSRLKLSRQFQFIRRHDGQTLLTARTDFICIALSSGKPARMPTKFAEVYGNAVIQAVQT